jgi:WXG100 family type VII secretion target
MWNLVDVEPGTLALAANRVQQTRDTLGLLQQRVEQRRTALNAGWQSDAARLFDGLLDQFISGFQLCINQADSLHGGLTENAAQYHAHEQEAGRIVNRIAAQINYQ